MPAAATAPLFSILHTLKRERVRPFPRAKFSVEAGVSAYTA